MRRMSQFGAKQQKQNVESELPVAHDEMLDDD